MGQTERDEDEIRADLFFLPFILYHPYFILALTATATRYRHRRWPSQPARKAVVQREILSSLLDIAYNFSRRHSCRTMARMNFFTLNCLLPLRKENLKKNMSLTVSHLFLIFQKSLQLLPLAVFVQMFAMFYKFGK